MGAPVEGYLTAEVANLLGISTTKLVRWVRAGVIDPSVDAGGRYRFSFQDVVLLRSAKKLIDQRVPAARVRRALERLRTQVPDRPLSAVPIDVEGSQILASDGVDRWEPESGQTVFDFGSEVPAGVRSLPEIPELEREKTEDDLSADEWFELGDELEPVAPDQARDAYRRCLELDPEHGEARISLGRVLMYKRWLDSAQSHFRIAHTLAPDDPVASFHLGLALEALHRDAEAVGFLEAAIRLDERYEDALVALARVQERLGDAQGVLRTLGALHRLRGPD